MHQPLSSPSQIHPLDVAAGLVESARSNSISYCHGPRVVHAGTSDRHGRQQLYCNMLHVCLEAILRRVFIHSLPAMTIVIMDKHSPQTLILKPPAS